MLKLPIIEAFGEHNIGFAVATDASPNSDGKNANVVQILTLHSAKGLEGKLSTFAELRWASTRSLMLRLKTQEMRKAVIFVAMTRAEKGTSYLVGEKNDLLAVKR